jgi:hypothetical protein
MLLPKSFIACTGSLNIALNVSTTPPALSNIKLKKSLKAMLKTSNAVLNKSNTF